jgi:hypothetical protein
MSLLLMLIIIGVVFTFVANTRKAPQGGAPTRGPNDDLLAYLLLALAVGGAAISLSQLGRAAFPTGGFVFEPERQVAAALAGLVVTVPVALYLWRRQAIRRELHPNAGGWTMYLSLVEAAFMTAFAVNLYQALNWAIGDGRPTFVTDLIVVAAALAFHEWAVRATPPISEAAELPRIIGSAVGLVALALGVGMALIWMFSQLLPADARPGGEVSWESGLAAILTGGLIWWYRWLRPWRREPGPARHAWLFLVSTGGLALALGSFGVITSRLIVLLAIRPRSTDQYLSELPYTTAALIVGLLVWAHHRKRMGSERTDPVRSYEYAIAALGMFTAVIALTSLVTTTFSRTVIVGSLGEGAFHAATYLLIGGFTWFRFWGRAERAPKDEETGSGPRRSYLIGLGVIMALMAAGALIATLVGVFQLILGVGGLTDNFPTTITLTLAAGGAAWHLLGTYNRDKKTLDVGERVAPFDVTVVCSHPGTLATRLPTTARMRVVYRGDALGTVDDAMADDIVEAVGTTSSYVWVDETGFRVAPAR